MLAYVDIEETEASVAEMLRVLSTTPKPEMIRGGGMREMMPGMTAGMSGQFRHFECKRLLNLIATSGIR